MFRKHYKQAYDKIEGDKTQIARILAMANSEQPKKKKAFSFRFGTAFAAVLVLCVSVYSLPQLRESTEPIQEKTTQEETIFVPDPSIEFHAQDEIQNPDTVVNENKASKNKAESAPVEANESFVAKQNDTVQKKSETVVESNVEPVDSADIAQETPADDAPAVANEMRMLPPPEAMPAALSADEKVVSDQSSGGSGAAPAPVSRMAMPESYPRTFDDGSYATVTIYQQNDAIENAFLNSASENIAGAQTIIYNSEDETTILVKTENSYAEITGVNLTDENITTLVSEIPH